MIGVGDNYSAKGRVSRFLDCLESLDYSGQEVIADAVTARWKAPKAIAAVIELAENRAFAFDLNAELDAALGNIKETS